MVTSTRSPIVSHRYDFVFLFDVQDGNPNGDPDAGNMPRVDPVTMHGLVTDVALKRKVRDYVEAAYGDQAPYRIYVRHQSRGGTFLNALHREAQDAVQLSGDRKNPDPKQREDARQWMAAHFFDVRAFGAVMTTEVNAGQVRGPVQLTFARSIDPVEPMENTLTRVAKTTAERADRAGTTEIGRKWTVPYGLYRAHGFISPSFARDTGFTEADLAVLWEALERLFWDDHSATRGLMATRGLYVFEHERAIGNAPAHQLFERITIERRPEVKAARTFRDYVVEVQERLPPGVSLHRLVEA
jgi:CRISPR-associated protein Csd2